MLQVRAKLMEIELSFVAVQMAPSSPSSSSSSSSSKKNE